MNRPPARHDGPPADHSQLRILLIDASRLFAEAMRNRLLAEHDVTTVITAGGAPEALRLLAEQPFAAVVAAPGLARELWTSPGPSAYPSPTVPVVVLADAGDVAQARELFRLGAVGWVDRSRSIAYLMEAIWTCCRGDACIPAEVLALLVADQAPSEAPEAARQRVLSALTHREKQVFMLLEQGMGRNEIAAILQLSPNTVRTHVHRILRRLNVHSSLAALALTRTTEHPA